MSAHIVCKFTLVHFVFNFYGIFLLPKEFTQNYYIFFTILLDSPPPKKRFFFFQNRISSCAHSCPSLLSGTIMLFPSFMVLMKALQQSPCLSDSNHPYLSTLHGPLFLNPSWSDPVRIVVTLANILSPFQ